MKFAPFAKMPRTSFRPLTMAIATDGLVNRRFSDLSNQFDCGRFILTINQKRIEVPILEPGLGHPQVAARFHRDAQSLAEFG